MSAGLVAVIVSGLAFFGGVVFLFYALGENTYLEKKLK